MNLKRCLLGSLVGGIVLFFLGYALFGVLLVGFFEANQGSATGVTREPLDFVTLGLAQLVWGGTLAMLIDWKGASTPVDAAKTAATAGGLFMLGLDLTLYATTNMSTLTGSLADAVVSTILFGIAGAAISLAVGKKATA
jgi:hypothetical protein